MQFLVSIIALAVAAPVQDEYPPLPTSGVWAYDFLATNFGGLEDSKPKACTGKDVVVDLDAAKVQGVERNKFSRYVYAPVGPRDGSKPVEWLLLEHSYVTGAVMNTALTQFVPVPDTAGPKGAALIRQLVDPKTRQAATEAVQARFAAGGRQRKDYRRCQK